MKSMTRMALALAIAQLGVSCGEPQLPLQPTLPGPAFEIQDAVHNSGNGHFLFLPPMVPQPKFSGTFDANESPTVVVCGWTGTACGTIVAQFSMSSGTGSQVVRVDALGEAYSVNWNTNQCITGPCKLAPGTFRIRVLVAGTELGHADVSLVANQQQVRTVNTSEFIPLVAGRTLTIKFRIEPGAVFVVGSSGGTITALGGQVTLVVPPGAVSQPTGITVVPATLPSGTNTTALVGGTAFDLGPTGTVFAGPVTLTIQYDPTNVPPGMAESTVRLFTLVNGHWVMVPGSRVNVSAHAVTGATSHFSIYGVQASASVSAARGGFSCGIGTTGSTVCWGDNSFGQLGNGATGGFSTTPTAVATPGFSLTAVSTGAYSACGFTAPGQAYCWGYNGSHQLGNGTTTDSPTPTLVASAVAFRAVSMGAESSCGINDIGAAYCWGGFSSTPQSISAPTGVSFSPVVSVAGLFLVDSAVACTIATNGQAHCWGESDGGAVGNGSANVTEPVPVAVVTPSGEAGFTVVSAGGEEATALPGGPSHFFTCGVGSTTGTVYCWGDNSVGQLGNNTVVGLSLTPVPIIAPAGATFATVTAGRRHACALTTMGDLYCWGDNTYGQLGNGLTTASPTPVAVTAPVNVKFSSVSAGGAHTCAIASAPDPNTAYCWGANSSGQLGIGTTEEQHMPVQVSTPVP